MGKLSVGRRVFGVSGHEGTDEAASAVLGTIVAEPDRTKGNRIAVLVFGPIDAAVIVGTADKNVCVPGIDSYGRFVFPAAGDGTLVENDIGVGSSSRDCVGAHVTTAWEVTREPDVGARCLG